MFLQRAYISAEVVDRPVPIVLFHFLFFFWSVKLVYKMAVHESGDFKRRAIGPLLGTGGGRLKAEGCPGFLGF